MKENMTVADDKSGDGREEGGKPDPERTRNHQSGSFLVRFWVEPSDSGEQVLRGCIKNLQTGKEQYVTDPEKIGDLVRGHLKDKDKEKEKGEREKETEKDGDQTWVGQH
jgi:hypothetical protein